MPGVRVDLHFDGYVMPDERPLILVEPMQINNEIRAKQREAIETIYRYQIGLYGKTSVDLSVNQERLQQVFNFDRITFYNTLKEPAEQAGFFYCDLTAVVPMPADTLSQKSDYHRVYFDVEIQDTKRRCR